LGSNSIQKFEKKKIQNTKRVLGKFVNMFVFRFLSLKKKIELSILKVQNHDF